MAFGTGALFHAQTGAKGGKFLCGFGNQGDPAFAGGAFPSHGNA
jgi:hypothetical protein